MQLESKTAIVTGAAQGIGAAIAREFISEGANVVIADVQDERGAQLAAELGERCRYSHCDVGDFDHVTRLVEITCDWFGGIDVAVSNAGISQNAEILDISEADFDRVLRVNLKGGFLVGQASARKMVAQGRKGVIINMSSINAVVCSPHIVPYAVSKGGLNQLTAVMALGLAKHGIRVNGIGPGSIETELLAQIVNTDPAALKNILSRTPMGRLGQPEEIAKIAVFLASDASSYMTGQTIYADGGRLPLAYTVPVPA
jgi:NAD(P)-dependent dehydrogenase (short-subunit alcohol dehydrogenase family)